MERRAFCKLIAAAAASRAVPSFSGEQRDAPPVIPSLLSEYGRNYAQFCALGELQRRYLEVRDGRFVEESLDPATWSVSPNSESGPRRPPSLPVPGGSWNGVPMEPPVPGLSGEGPFEASWPSLMGYEAPEWYRDAKFGIWAHWSPQCVPERGDWYARNMYIQGSDQYEYHLKRFGHPSKFGYKDLCPQWTLKNWDPDALISRYKKAGARFFLTLANHHDNFDAWDSRFNPWNSVNVGPRRDVVGTWAAAARRQGLRLGVTIHQPRNWWWMQPSHGADISGPLLGVPYDGRLTGADGKGQWWDGLDPQRLYAPKHPPMALPDVSYVRDFYERTRDLIDRYDPDLLYLDNAMLPLGWGGMAAAAYFYNHSLKTRSGKMEAVLTTKQVPDRLAKALVADIERGIVSGSAPYPWQSETCIGGWHYDRRLYDQPGLYGGYQNPRDIVHWLIDTVSRNGTFILNVPGRPDGTIDSKEIAVLGGISRWIETNGEAIYSTRPWTLVGEGPSMAGARAQGADGASLLTANDIRFTRNKEGTMVYAFVLGWPSGEVVIESLGLGSPGAPGKVHAIELLGSSETIRFRQGSEALRLQCPAKPPCEYACAFKIRLA